MMAVLVIIMGLLLFIMSVLAWDIQDLKVRIKKLKDRK